MTTVPAAYHPRAAEAFATLPSAARVLVVISRPGLESEHLGGLVYAFRRAGASLSLLCLTRGEASPRNRSRARLEAIRPWELQLASAVLGIGELTVGSFPDGTLHRRQPAELADRIDRAIRQYSADLLLVIAPEAGDRDDAAVAVAAQAAAARAAVPVLARTRPSAAPGAWMIDLGANAATARAIQKAAMGAHSSQAEALPALVRQLDLLDGRETLRWLLLPQSVPPQAMSRPAITSAADDPA